MDDLAPAAAQRASDDGGRVREDRLTARKKAGKKAPPAPEPEPQTQPEVPIEPAGDHLLDILA